MPRPYEVRRQEHSMEYSVTRPCFSCPESTTAEVHPQSLWDYEHGSFAQVAFPYLSVELREAVFISGMCVACQERVFA